MACQREARGARGEGAVVAVAVAAAAASTATKEGAALDADSDSDSKSLWRGVGGAVGQSLMLALQLAAYGVIGTLPLALFWLPYREGPQHAPLRVNVAANETVFLDRSFKNDVRHALAFYAYSTFPFFSYFVMVIATSLQLPWRQVLALLATTPLVTLPVHFSGAEMANVAHAVIAVAPFTMQWALLRRFCPRDSKMPTVMLHAGLLSMSCAAGIRAVQFTSASNSVLAVLLVFPLLKEIISFQMRETARRVVLDARVGGTGVAIRRDVAWALAAASFLLFAIYTRLVFSRVETVEQRNLVIAVQSVTEIAMRVSVEWRDEALRAVLRRCRRLVGASKSRRATVLVSPHLAGTPLAPESVLDAVANANANANANSNSIANVNANASPGPRAASDGGSSAVLKAPKGGPPQASPSRASSSRASRPVTIAKDLAEAAASRKRFYGSMIVLEELCEYTAIFTAPLIILLYRRDVLVLPLEFYALQSNIFDEPANTSPLLAWTLTQLVAELAVDAVCGGSIIYNGAIDLAGAWRERSRDFALWYVYASHFVQLSVATFYQLDDFAACFDDDLCACVDNGLQPGGVRDLYCARLAANDAALPLPT